MTNRVALIIVLSVNHILSRRMLYTKLSRLIVRPLRTPVSFRSQTCDDYNASTRRFHRFRGTITAPQLQTFFNK